LNTIKCQSHFFFPNSAVSHCNCFVFKAQIKTATTKNTDSVATEKNNDMASAQTI